LCFCCQAGRATSEVAAQLRQILWHDWAIAGLFGASVPESLSERNEQNRLSLRALETPPTAMTLGIILSPELGTGCT